MEVVATEDLGVLACSYGYVERVEGGMEHKRLEIFTFHETWTCKRAGYGALGDDQGTHATAGWP